MKTKNTLIVSFLFFFIVACDPKSDETSQVIPSADSKGIKRDDAVIDYHVTGKGDTTLLFVHGAFIDQTYWKEQVDHFSQHYIVVTMDLPGHGKSSKTRKDWSLESFADDVKEVINVLNLKNVILVGHSMAGDINLLVASHMSSPVIGFIGIDNFKDAGTPIPESIRPLIDSIQKAMLSDFAHTNESFAQSALLSPQTPAAVVARVTTDFKNAYKPMAIQLMNKLPEAYQLEQQLLPKLGYKLYLINVNNSPTDEKALKQYTGTSGYKVYTIKGTSHYPMIESPEQFNEVLQKVIWKMGRN
ncbi:MAG TPA: alpha/beta hydrolase [Bacteroidia bacterium]|jgi:pimeloyl-ACP methyl ester carboxylesterase|nr:alpha/beta hydrolase [Bacteroidia bacterium]